EKVLRHQLERAPALSQFRSDLHPDLIAIVNRLMRKDPAERHQTPIEVAEDLAGFMGRTTIKLFTWPPLTRSKKGGRLAAPLAPKGAPPEAVRTVPVNGAPAAAPRLSDLVKKTRLPGLDGDGLADTSILSQLDTPTTGPESS